MQTLKQYSNHLLLPILFMLTVFIAGCGSDGDPILESSTGTTTATPVVLSTTPIDGDVNVTRNTNITAFFDKELDDTTVNTTTFTLKNGVTAVAGVVSYANKAMIFNPTSNLDANTTYDATITTGVKDLDGNALATEYVWSFETGDVIDVTAPILVSTDPDDNATNVPTNRSASALFNETLDPSTVTTATFTLKKGTTAVTGVVSYASKTMIFDPTVDLDANTTYDANITTGVTDLAGNAFAGTAWSFTTGDAPVPALAPVNLGTAGSFVILSKTGITTTGTTAITGDIGVSPIARTAITGFGMIADSTDKFATSSLVTGKIYAADMAAPTPAKMTAAVGDMEIAYADAAGRTNPDFTELYAGDVSGKTLVPGLYKWGTGVLMTSDVTLSGGATDVWIFQIAQDLTISSNVKVILSGGALAKNIFWQVAGLTGVSIGTGAEFRGIALAKTAIIVSTGATVDKGRLLAQTKVTLDANTVTKPLD